MREGFASAVAGGRHTHETGIEFVLHVALEYTLLNERGALAGGALVVHVEGTAAILEGAIVHHGAEFDATFSPDASGKCRRALTVEIALKTVADGLVQQDTRPAGAQHHSHGARRGRHSVQVHQRRSHRFTGDVQRTL